MNEKENALSTAFLENAPCEITYRDLAGRWTHRTIWIKELRRDHVVARCESRRSEYRRFNLNCIREASPVAPPTL